MTQPEKTAVMACMRNEGLLVLEWIAYHKTIGFDEIIICTNACTDGSDHLLDALHSMGEITHIPHVVATDDTPQDSGMRATFAHLAASDITWLAHIDADEFIDIGHGAGTVQDLLAMAGMGDVIALPWWAFGDSNHIAWPGSILDHFTLAEIAPDPDRCKFKSMFRVRAFTHANDHMPTGAKSQTVDVRSAAGLSLKSEGHHDKKRAKYRPFDRSICPDAACINHYAVPSRDVFLLKNDRGDGQGKSTDKYHLGSRWHSTANQNARPRTRILRHLAATQSELTRLRGRTGIAALERASQSWATTRMAELLTPERISSWSKPTYQAGHS